MGIEPCRWSGRSGDAGWRERSGERRSGGELLVAFAVIAGRGRRRRLGDSQQTAAMGQVGGAPAVGEIAVVADAMEAVRQNVEQEAADELVGAKGHHLLLVVVAIILPAEADPALGKTDKAAVGDGNAMGIAGEIIEHLLRSAERALGVD